MTAPQGIRVTQGLADNTINTHAEYRTRSAALSISGLHRRLTYTTLTQTFLPRPLS
jgi:hypothetical protein